MQWNMHQQGVCCFNTSFCFLKFSNSTNFWTSLVFIAALLVLSWITRTCFFSRTLISLTFELVVISQQIQKHGIHFILLPFTFAPFQCVKWPEVNILNVYLNPGYGEDEYKSEIWCDGLAVMFVFVLFAFFHVCSYTFLYLVNNVRLVLMSLCFVSF